MKTQWCVRLQYMALAGVVLIGLITSAYATSEVTELAQAQNPTLPIIINQPGLYRLISNITAQGNAIEIASNDVTLDLNGFSIHAGGAGVITITPPPGPRGSIVVVNGTIFAQAGAIVLGTAIPGVGDCRIERVLVRGSNGSGIRAFENCIVSHNTIATSNGGIVIEGLGAVVKDNTLVNNGGPSIQCRSCVVSGNSVRSTFGGNVLGAIVAKEGSLVLGNTVSFSQGVGLELDATTGYANNVLSNNTGGDVSGGVQIGTNLCATNSICPP